MLFLHVLLLLLPPGAFPGDNDTEPPPQRHRSIPTFPAPSFTRTGTFGPQNRKGGLSSFPNTNTPRKGENQTIPRPETFLSLLVCFFQVSTLELWGFFCSFRVFVKHGKSVFSKAWLVPENVGKARKACLESKKRMHCAGKLNWSPC